MDGLNTSSYVHPPIFFEYDQIHHTWDILTCQPAPSAFVVQKDISCHGLGSDKEEGLLHQRSKNLGM